MNPTPLRRIARPRPAAAPRVRRLRRLRPADLPADTEALARYLLGKLIVRRFGARPGARTVAVRIVETEAYVQGDAACHAYGGPTRRNLSLFLPPGHAYVYLCYGVSWLLNVSSEAAGIGSGVLLRAAEPVRGVDLLRRGRGRLEDVCKGPGRLTRALQVDGRFDGADLLAGRELWLAEDGTTAGDVAVSVRIGITKSADLPLRFFVRGSPGVSGAKRFNS